MPFDNHECCKVCDYYKTIDQICLKCKKYINEATTPTVVCSICSLSKLKDEPCYHSHDFSFKAANICKDPIVIKNEELAPCTIQPIAINSFVFFNPWVQPSEEIIRIAKDGFWVRGVKVEQGPLEAKEVYKAFLKLLGFSSDHLREETQDSEASGSETN